MISLPANRYSGKIFNKHMTTREKFMAIVDGDQLKKSDAIILLEGDGTNRCAEAIELFQNGYAPKLVFSGNVNNLSYGSLPFSTIAPLLAAGRVPTKAIIHESKSLNTKEQAEEVVRLAIKKGWRRLILVASHYHQYRAYLTFLKAVLDTESGIILYNAPARRLDWFAETGWGKRFDLLTQEFDRIKKYASYSHLATFQEAIDYQKWKEQQA